MTTALWSAALACPDCRSSLETTTDGHRCAGCARLFPADPIPTFLPARPADGSSAQASFYDEHKDWHHEVVRPWDRPRFHAWLLEEKTRAGLSALPGNSRKAASVLVVCGGSGLDAEILTRAGATVVSSDISVGASRRAQERAHLRGLYYDVMVADAQRLPFRDGSIDVVYVHDGLHHLESPDVGASEMLRVARIAAVISEPTPSSVTDAAIRLGVADRVEEAGNQVKRLRPDRLRCLAGDAGFDVARARRYGMFYRDGTGAFTRLASHPGVFPVARALARMAMRLTAPVGNKLVFVAVRRS
jgi:SAM-dependent methyltransferase